jgi:hypothetical protein
MRGSCHCGKVAYHTDVEPKEAMSCNCSICRRKGHVLMFITPDKFTLETPRENIGAYTFKSHSIRHLFCTNCGCSPFNEGTDPKGNKMVALNLRCAEDVDLTKITIKEFDGASLP